MKSLRDYSREISAKEKKGSRWRSWKVLLKISRSMSFQEIKKKGSYSKKRKIGFSGKRVINFSPLTISARSWGSPRLTYGEGCSPGRMQNARRVCFRGKIPRR